MGRHLLRVDKRMTSRHRKTRRAQKAAERNVIHSSHHTEASNSHGGQCLLPHSAVDVLVEVQGWRKDVDRKVESTLHLFDPALSPRGANHDKVDAAWRGLANCEHDVPEKPTYLSE